MKRHGKLKSEFWLYMRLFVVLSLTTIILIGSIQYVLSYSTIEKNVAESGASLLSLLMNTHDMILSSVDDSVQNIYDDEFVEDYMYYFNKNSHNICRNVAKLIPSVAENNRYINSICVYYMPYDYTISSDYGPAQSEWYYDSDFLHSISNEDLHFWRKRTVTDYKGISTEVLTAVKTLPLFNASGKAKTYLVINLNMEEINRVLKLFSGKNDLSLMVTDGNSNIIAELGIDAKENELIAGMSIPDAGSVQTCEINDLLIQSASTKRGWTYYLIFSDKDIMGGVSEMRVRLFTVSGLALLISTVMSLLFSKRIFEPIRTISNRFDDIFGAEADNKSRETQRIITRVDLLIARNRALAEEIALKDGEYTLECNVTEYENDLLRAIKNCDKVLVRQVLDQLLSRIAKKYTGGTGALALYESLYASVQDIVQDGDQVSKITGKTLGEMDSCLEQLCNSMIERIMQTLPTEYSGLVSDACAYINANLSEDLSIESISGVLFTSASNLRRLFRIETGVTVKEYIDGQRIEAAKRMLSESDLQIKEIALQVGFKYPQSFIAFFKSAVKLTPGEYREQSKN